MYIGTGNVSKWSTKQTLLRYPETFYLDRWLAEDRQNSNKEHEKLVVELNIETTLSQPTVLTTKVTQIRKVSLCWCIGSGCPGESGDEEDSSSADNNWLAKASTEPLSKIIFLVFPLPCYHPAFLHDLSC